jgi:hypothetical protein
MLSVMKMPAGNSIIVIALLVGACSAAQPAQGNGDGAASPGAAGAAPSPTAGARSAAQYEVPIEPALAAAAVFDVTNVQWRASGERAKLYYPLPRELVGKTVQVELEGAVAADGTAQLTGDAGVADCTVTASDLTCREQLMGLSPVEPDLTVVEELAAASYAGPASDRLAVARAFGADPIGILRVDLSAADGKEVEQEHR